MFLKNAIMGFLIGLVVTALLYLCFADNTNVLTFLAQSVVDNAIFCIMFVVVVIVTGISC